MSYQLPISTSSVSINIQPVEALVSILEIEALLAPIP